MQALVLDYLHLALGCRDPLVACSQVVSSLAYVPLSASPCCCVRVLPYLSPCLEEARPLSCMTCVRAHGTA